MRTTPTPAGAVLALALVLGAPAAPEALAARAPDEAWTLYEQGSLRRAASLCEKRLAANPSDAVANLVLARVRIQQQQLDDAFKLANAAVAAAPNDPDAHFALGAACGRKAQAASVLKAPGFAGKVKKAGEAALALDPNHADALGLLVDFYQNAPGIMGGDKKKAKEYVDRLVSVDPAAGWAKRAGLAFSDKDTTLGGQCLAKAHELAPENVRAMVSLASWLAQPWRDLPRAEKLAKQVVEKEPWRVGGWQVLAGIYAYQERWAELDDVLARSQAVDATHLAPWYTAGRTIVVMGKDAARAERCLRHYLSREPEFGSPTHANARWRLGQALEQQGKKDEALAELQASVKADPKNEDAKKDLKRLKG
jgi:tetratricopeptide (TPR) repeat protein